jgi:hypothetical protein
MVQRGDRARFAVETIARVAGGGRRRTQHFDGDGAMEPGVAGFVNVAHSSRPDPRLDLVRSESLAFETPGARSRLEWQGRRRFEEGASTVVRVEQLLDLFADRRLAFAGPREVRAPLRRRQHQRRLEDLPDA